jgi:hypothetical protein
MQRRVKASGGRKSPVLSLQQGTYVPRSPKLPWFVVDEVELFGTWCVFLTKYPVLACRFALSKSTKR